MYILLFDVAKPGHKLFKDKEDIARFEALLDRVNNNIPLRSKWWKDKTEKIKVLNIVNIIFCQINKDYFYLLIDTDEIKHKRRFMLRLKTAYTMYYNRKYKHSGSVFYTQSKMRIIEQENLDKIKDLLKIGLPKIKDVRTIDRMIRGDISI